MASDTRSSPAPPSSPADLSRAHGHSHNNSPHHRPHNPFHYGSHGLGNQQFEYLYPSSDGSGPVQQYFDSASSPNTALRQLLTYSHAKYSAYPVTTSRDELVRVFSLLDEWTKHFVLQGLVQPARPPSSESPSPLTSSMFSLPAVGPQFQFQPSAARYHFDPNIADCTSSVLEAWLLGGCIAYTLGDMNRAVDWNARILRVDSYRLTIFILNSYVEAMSNLAAAYRALHRYNDAEAWWNRAIQLRPSYWDAADHLFTLLCHQQQYDKASNILQFVESHAISSNISADLPRFLAILHAKGTLLYSMEDYVGAAEAYSRVLAFAACGRVDLLEAPSKLPSNTPSDRNEQPSASSSFQMLVLQARTALGARYGPRLLLTPLQAQSCLTDVFGGDLPGIRSINDVSRRQAISHTTANTLLTLAKILQDAIATGNASNSSGTNKQTELSDKEHPPHDSAEGIQSTERSHKFISRSHTNKAASLAVLNLIMGRMPSVYDVLPMYYLSLALHPSASTANNIGILLASLAPALPIPREHMLALEYYRYGLTLDNRHPHLYTNLGSLLKDQGQITEAIRMYECAVACDIHFDIALANLANAVRDQGRVEEAIEYYRRAVAVNPNFDEASCGLANALSSVCDWAGRGCAGAELVGVDDAGNICGVNKSGWISKITETVDRQLRNAQSWGRGIVSAEYDNIANEIMLALGLSSVNDPRMDIWLNELMNIQVSAIDEGSKLVELLEAAARFSRWRAYQEFYVRRSSSEGISRSISEFHRPKLPSSLLLPVAPTVLPFHTFTMPFNPIEVREISRRTALRVSVSAMRSEWLPPYVYPPPPPPTEYLRVGYVSSDFNNHPLSHLMQNVFGYHYESVGTQFPVYGICYATTASDSSPYRLKIEAEAHEFIDVSKWSTHDIVERIVKDGIHILVNLNGFTRGARNDIFVCRPAPLSISFMGFAGSMGSEWMDYLLADKVTVPPSTVRQFKAGHNLSHKILRHHDLENDNSWVYFEDLVFCRHSFFCCDQKQSAPDAHNEQSDHWSPEEHEQNLESKWQEEVTRRNAMRRELFPQLPPETIIFANFNQLYKIDPAIFMTWLKILIRVPNSVLWLLTFPKTGMTHLLEFATKWAGPAIARRIIFTNVATKEGHLLRCRVPDLVLDTPECNAHTTATDVIWAGTPLLTFARHEHKMCSRIATSVLLSALPPDTESSMASRLIVSSEAEYEQCAVDLASTNCGSELLEIRRTLFLRRTKADIFDTRRWTRDLERAYWMMWNRWLDKGGDIIIDQDKDRNLYL
ncbi:glycosyl transferase family 41-domain-containing protein [Lipomyces oligophaga]|uniref:glycosyl transferase family 41-domain-containing protein n=1 Tax=Lipomyces oligophaga TaxID=45792 RepID=UPI0034CD5C13